MMTGLKTTFATAFTLAWIATIIMFAIHGDFRYAVVMFLAPCIVLSVLFIWGLLLQPVLVTACATPDPSNTRCYIESSIADPKPILTGIHDWELATPFRCATLDYVDHHDAGYGEIVFRSGPTGSYLGMCKQLALDTGIVTLRPDIPPDLAHWTAVHEIGHAIGMSHADQSAISVMTPLSTAFETPTHYDIAEYARLYP